MTASVFAAAGLLGGVLNELCGWFLPWRRRNEHPSDNAEASDE